MIGGFLSLVIIAGAVLLLLGAASHAIRVLLGGEYSYDPKVRREAVWSALFAIGLAVALFLWLFRGCAF